MTFSPSTYCTNITDTPATGTVWTVEMVEMLVSLGVVYKPQSGGTWPSMNWETATPQGTLQVSGYLEACDDWRYFVTYRDGTWKSDQPRLRTRVLREAYVKVAEILNEDDDHVPV